MLNGLSNYHNLVPRVYFCYEQIAEKYSGNKVVTVLNNCELLLCEVKFHEHIKKAIAFRTFSQL